LQQHANNELALLIAGFQRATRASGQTGSNADWLHPANDGVIHGRLSTNKQPVLQFNLEAGLMRA
jgi:hypothetical protein